MKAYKKLGFSHLETTEIVHALNHLLANYQVHYQKLRGFHWNVEGRDFFELHEEFEKEYNQVKKNIDKIAERIRIFGETPYFTLGQYLNIAEIKEVKTVIAPEQMVEEIVDDFETLLSFMIDVMDAAKSIGDTGTINMVNDFIERMEKRHWMFTSWLKKTLVEIPSELS